MSTAIAQQLALVFMGRSLDTQWASSTANLLNGGQPSVALQTAFYNSAVAEGVFSTSDSPSGLVNDIFQNIFGFGASSFEQTAWGNLITNGTLTKETAAWTIFKSYLGATNVPDAYKLPAQSKLVAMNAYSTELAADAEANLALAGGGKAAAAARAYVSGVTSQATAATAISGVAASVDALPTASAPTYTLTSSAASVNEGGAINFTLAATNVAAGTQQAYTITGVNSADVVGGSLSGVATIGADGKATISVTLAADATTEGAETLTVSVAGKTASATVNDTSIAPVPTYALAADAASVNEGGTATFVLATTNVAAGSSFDYTITGVSAADVTGGKLSGSAIVGADGKAVISVGTVADSLTEGAETMTVSVAGKSAAVTVADTSTTPVPTYALAADAASVNEGGTAIFRLTTTNVAAGSKFDYTLAGVSAADVVGGLLAGTATVGTDGKAIVEVTLTADALTEGAETLTMALAGQSASTTVNDTSLTSTSFVLTTNADNIAGSTGNDTINANWTAATGMTFQGSDSIDGGAGTDTLYIQAGTAGTFTAGSLTNVETLSVNVLAAVASTIDLLGSTGVTTVAVDGSLAGSTSAYSNIGSTSVALKSAYTGGNVTFGYTAAAVAGTADSATLTLSNVTGGTQTIAGIETLNIVSATGPNTVTGLVTANTTKIVMTGGQSLSTGTLGTTVTNVDASAATGGLTTTLGVVAAATVTGGAGNDSFTLDAVTGTVNATGGAGNDTFTAAALLGITDTISGGDGTDTLSSVFALVSTAGYTTPTTRTITGIETLSVSDDLAGALTAVGIDTGITSVTMANNGVNTAAAVTFNAGNSTLNIGTSTTTAGALATSLAVVGATTGLDNITVKNSNLSTVNAFAGVAITATGTETLTINTGSYTTAVAQTAGAVSVIGSVGFQTAETLVITGANILTLGAVTADIINASAMTSVTGTTLTTVTGTNAQTVTGSGGNDVLVADTTANVSVSGGAGNDTITGGAGNDTLLGDAGNDSITSAAGNDSVDGGAGNDTVVMGTEFSLSDTLVGGDGTDILSIGQAATATIAARASGFETLTLSAGATQDMSLFTNNSTFTRVNVVTGTNSFTKVGAGVVTLGSSAATTAISFALNAGGGTSDALTVSVADNVTQTAVTANDIEVMTLNNAATATAATAATITTLAASSLTTLNVTGLAGMVVTNAITGATALATVTDTHTGAGALTLDLSSSTVATTFTGGTATGATTLIMGSGANIVTANSATTVGNMTVTGGAGAESMTGGWGADSFSGGAGADTLIGGEGADTLQGGAGNDSISGGGGADAFTTDSGADTIDGGAGTDVLTVSASYRDISGDTISSVETLNMASNATTMSIAQHAGFTTFSSVAGITFSDAGTITGKTNVTTYTLANGTNAFTASTTGLNNVLTGGTGADTFNFGLDAAGTAQLFDTNDTVLGGAGTDTVNFTANLAFTVTLGDATKFTGIENVVFSNTTTNVTLVTDSATLANGESMTIDGSASTTGVMTFTGSAEAGTGTYNLIGGSAADSLTGGTGADTITGGAGADRITGGAGADNLTGGAGADIFLFSGTAGATTSGTPFGTFDTITDFLVGTDKIAIVSAATEVVSAQQAAVQAAVTALAAGSSDLQVFTAMALANTTDFGVSFATFGGNSYSLYETLGAGLGVAADDVSIKLLGITTIPTFAADVIFA